MHRQIVLLIFLISVLESTPALAVECPSGCVPREQAAEISPDADPYACPAGCVWYSDIVKRVGEKAPEAAPAAPPAIVPEPTLLETTTQPQTDATAPETTPEPATKPVVQAEPETPAPALEPEPQTPAAQPEPVTPPQTPAPKPKPHAQTPAPPAAAPEPPVVAMREKKKKRAEPQAKVPYIQSRRDTLPDSSSIAKLRYRNVLFPTGYGLEKGRSVLMVENFSIIDYQYGVTDHFQFGLTAPMPYIIAGAFPSLRGHGRLSEHVFMSGGLFGGGFACYHDEPCAVLAGGGYVAWTGVFKRSSFTLGAASIAALYYDYDAYEWERGWRSAESVYLVPKAGYRWEVKAHIAFNLEVTPILALPFHKGEKEEIPILVSAGLSQIWGNFILEYGAIIMGISNSKSSHSVIPIPFLNLGGTF